MSGFRPRFFVDQPPPGPSAGDPPHKGMDVLREGVEVTLDQRDSHHAQRVLRLQVGDPCEVVMGGTTFEARVSNAGQPVKVVLGEPLQGTDAGAVYRGRVGLVQALTRPALVDQVLEKGTEVGASFFLLVPAAGSTRLRDGSRLSRLDRWRRIVVEAAKQSKQSVVPVVELFDSAESAGERLDEQGIGSVVLEPTAPATIREVLEQLSASGAESQAAPGEKAVAAGGIALWSGPESGWSDQELEWFAATGMQTARLGQSILRAETAGPVAVAVTRLVTGDW